MKITGVLCNSDSIVRNVSLNLLITPVGSSDVKSKSSEQKRKRCVPWKTALLDKKAKKLNIGFQKSCKVLVFLAYFLLLFNSFTF